MKPKFAVIVQDGLVQSIVSHDPAFIAVDFVVIDYDTEGADRDDLRPIPQGDGKTELAFYGLRTTERADIDYSDAATAEAPPDRIDPGAQVFLVSDGERWIGSYGDFSAGTNLQPDEEAEIARAIRETGEYKGGGGASPVWTLKLADRVEA